MRRRGELLRWWALILLIPLFQNCGGCENTAKFVTAAQSTGPTGNGEPYDIKPSPGQYYRSVPGFKCASAPRVYESITVDDVKGVLHSVDPATCLEVSKDLSLTSLDARSFDPDHLGYLEGAFVRSATPPDPSALNGPLLEAWCRADSDVLAFDLAVYQDLSLGNVSAKAYLPNQPLQITGVTKSLSAGALEYSGAGLKLSIDMRTSAGEVDYELVGQSIQTNMICRTAGWLDPKEATSPTFALNFSAAVLPPVVSFTRASTATYFDAAGVLKTASADVPRFDYDPLTGALEGLHIEQAATNSIVESAGLDSASYNFQNLTVVADQSTAPDGSQTAESLIASTANAYHLLGQDINGLRLDQPKSCSVFVKPNGVSRGMLKIEKTANDMIQLEFDLVAGTSRAVTYGTGAQPSGSVTRLANGWYRLAVSGIPDPSTGVQTLGCTLFVGMGAASGSTFTGDGASGFFAWGFQLEEGSLATSYIATGAQPVTRSADGAQVVDLSWHGPTAGTSFIEATKDSYPSGPSFGAAYLFSFGLSGMDEESALYDPVAGLTARLQDSASGSPMQWSSSLTPTAGALLKLGLTEDSMQAPELFVSGTSTAANATRAFDFRPNTFYLGNSSARAASWNGYVKSFTYWPSRLSDQTLSMLTN